jgi:hypothetical protein
LLDELPRLVEELELERDALELELLTALVGDLEVLPLDRLLLWLLLDGLLLLLDGLLLFDLDLEEADLQHFVRVGFTPVLISVNSSTGVGGSTPSRTGTQSQSSEQSSLESFHSSVPGYHW